MLPLIKTISWISRIPASSIAEHCLLCFCLLTPASSLFATQSPHIKFNQQVTQFRNLGTEDGLSHASATGIVQDKNGYLWIGTQAGLNRYSGDKFKSFLNDPHSKSSLSHDLVRVLYVDRKNNLWVGTKNGLNLYIADEEKFSRFLVGSGDKLSGIVRTIYEDSNNILWVGTAEGLYQLKGGNFEKYKIPVIESSGTISFIDDSIYSILEDSRSHLWIGTAYHGLIELDSSRIYLMTYDPGERGNPGEIVYTLFEDSKGEIWGGIYRKGVFTIDPQRNLLTVGSAINKNHTPITGGISDVMSDKVGNFWISTMNGLFQRKLGEIEFSHHTENAFNPVSLSSNLVEGIYEDLTGVLWISTQYGVSYWHPSYGAFRLLRNLKSAQTLVSLHNSTGFALDAKGNLLIALNGQGVFKWTGDEKQNRFWPLEEGGNNLVLQVTVDLLDNIWVTTMDRGLFYINTSSDEITHFLHDESDKKSIASNQVSSVQINSAGQVWITMFGGGLDRFDNGNFVHYSSGDTASRQIPTFITDASMDKQDVLWMCSDGWGVIAFDTAHEIATIYSPTNSNPENRLKSSWISTITAVDDEVWAASREELILFKDGKVKHLPIPDEEKLLAYAIEKDNRDHLWISTSYGLIEFDYQLGEVKRYDQSHGLQAADFISASSLRLPNGHLIFGGPRGFNIIDPEELGNSDFRPNIVLTDFKVAGKPHDLGLPIGTVTSIDLDYAQNIISFNFSALDFTSPTNNLYLHRLVGFSDEWLATAHGEEVTYTNLSPGNYLFEVKGSNSDGVFNPQPLYIRLSVNPPLWLSFWAKLTYFGIALILAVLVKSYYDEYLLSRERARHTEELTRQVFERTEELRQEVTQKEVLLKEVHHRVKNNMQIISSLLQIQATSVRDKKFDMLMNESIMRIQSMALIHESLYQSSDLTEINFSIYVDRLINEMHQSPLYSSATVEILNEAGKTGLPLDLAVPAGLILNELLSNSLKHAFDDSTNDPKVSIHFGLNEDNTGYILSVTDNGKGFPEEFDPTSPKTMGVDIVNLLTMQLGGEIFLHRSPDTCFEIRFPLNGNLG